MPSNADVTGAHVAAIDTTRKIDSLAMRTQLGLATSVDSLLDSNSADSLSQ